ncbi:hypothetical protein L7F22_025081 [Adiantum nelumboides]|nr:hypothetical protein [Adiantum nelumboides]
MLGPFMQANVKGRPEPRFMSFVIEELHAKILDIQLKNKAKVLKNELKEKKAEFLNKRDALIHREATASVASMIQTKITFVQTRYGTLKGANAIVEQLTAVEVQITAMSNAVKLIEGDDKIANMKIVVESIEDGLMQRVHIIMRFEIGHGYTENVAGVEEGNVYDLEIASLGGAEKSWSDHEGAKNVGHDTVPPESTILGATSKEGIEAVLGGNMDGEFVFLAEYVKRFKSNKRTATTIAPREGAANSWSSRQQNSVLVSSQQDDFVETNYLEFGLAKMTDLKEEEAYRIINERMDLASLDQRISILNHFTELLFPQENEGSSKEWKTTKLGSATRVMVVWTSNRTTPPPPRYQVGPNVNAVARADRLQPVLDQQPPLPHENRAMIKYAQPYEAPLPMSNAPMITDYEEPNESYITEPMYAEEPYQPWVVNEGLAQPSYVAQPSRDDLGARQDTTNTIYTDSQSVLAVVRKPCFHACTKHIEVHYHYVRERLLAK